MIKNYFKIAWRSFLSNKVYNSLNVLGLSVGMVCAGLIFLWVEDEVHYDQFNVKKDRLYFTKVNQQYDTYTATMGSTPGVMAPAMQTDITGIENTCRVTEDQTSLLFKIGEKTMYATGRYADTSFFSMFTLPFLQGNASVAFSQLHSVVLTEKTAKKFFGDDKNVLGKTVSIDNKQDYVVTGILKDLPQNSTLQFEWLVPFEVFYKQSPWAQKWGNSCVSSYVELKQGVELASVNKQLYNYLQQKQGTTTATAHAFLFSMNDWHLYDDFENGKKSGNGRIVYVRLFSTIAWIILFIACINFMNLATARSEKRAREVGVRKVMGAGKKRLLIQFISEAFLLALIAAVIAVVIMILVLPAFNSLVQKELSPGLNNPVHIVAIIMLVVACGFVAGSYPSFYLSSFNPIFVLKGLKLKSGSAANIRKGLVIAQFTVSIVLIIGTVIIYQQIQHVKSRNLGFNKENLVQMNLQGDMLKNFRVIKQDMLSAGIAENVAVTDHETIYSGNNTTAVEWPGKAANSNILVSQRLVSPEFIATAGLHIESGRDFQQTDIVEMNENAKPKDPNQVFSVIITQSMEKILGNGTAIGKTMQLPGSKENEYYNLSVTGVVNDYVYGDMYGKSSPVIFYCIPQATSLMYVRTKPSNKPEQLLSKMEAVMKKDNPAFPFEYKFVDEQFNEMFMSEMLISKLSQVFASLAILISCLGLFGLAAYTAERRTKEIGVRKVLGASTHGLAGLLSKDFLKLVGFSCLVAFPVAWFIMNNWLKQYAYRISIHWQIFFIAGGAAMAIAAATVSFQAVKAALANPVKSLKAE